MICFNHDNPFDEPSDRSEKALQNLLKQILNDGNPHSQNVYEGSYHSKLTTVDIEDMLYQIFFLENCGSINLTIDKEDDDSLSVIINEKK